MKIEEEEYLVGELVVPRTYKKIIVDKDGEIKESNFTVSARKIPLKQIRERELSRVEKLGLVRTKSDSYYDNLSFEEVTSRLKCLGEYKDETLEVMRKRLKMFERTRHFMLWQDNSTILNNGHILLMVTMLYDHAFFHTSQEMAQAGHPALDVQAEVEKPHLYIMGRCGSSDADHLCYIETRKQCLSDLGTNIKTSEGIEILDKMRFFHGDGPEQQFESGEQSGGNAGCAACKSDARKYPIIDYNMRQPVMSLADRQKKVMEGPAGRQQRNGGIKPFKNMSHAELQRECTERGLEFSDGKRPELERVLKEELGGIQRVPAMLVNDQHKDLADINLPMYEVLPTEPLHDIKEHIANVFKELPKHLNEQEASRFQVAREGTLGGKQCLKGADYRKSCIIIAEHMRGKPNLIYYCI